MFLCIGLLSLFHSSENDPVNHTCTRHLTVFKKKKRVAQGLIAVLVQLRYHMLVFSPPFCKCFCATDSLLLYKKSSKAHDLFCSCKRMDAIAKIT